MLDPVTSRWLRPATECPPPTPAHWWQHSEWPSLGTTGLAAFVWTVIVITTVIVTRIQKRERSHQHRLQHLQWETVQLLHQNITALIWLSRWHFLYTNVLMIFSKYLFIKAPHVMTNVVLYVMSIILLLRVKLKMSLSCPWDQSLCPCRCPWQLSPGTWTIVL